MLPRNSGRSGRAWGAGAAICGIAAVALLGGCKPGQIPGLPGQNGAPAMPVSSVASSWTTFTEPGENAFTVSAPQGWQVKGGIARTSPSDAKPWLTANTQDGSTTMFINDPRLPLFVSPDQQHQEGSVINNPYGQQMVHAYEGGGQFAAEYAQRVMSSDCVNMQLLGTRPEPELAQKTQAERERMAAAVGSRVPASATTYDGGSAQLAFQVNCAAYVVTVFAVTGKTQIGAGTLWTAGPVFGYRTPAPQVAQVDPVVRAMQASFQRTPEWDAKTTAAARQTMQTMLAQGDRAMAQMNQQSAQSSAMLRQNGENFAREQQQRQDVYMAQQGHQRDVRNNNFNTGLYNRQTGQENELRYINNRTCVVWYDAAHTRCKHEADN